MKWTGGVAERGLLLIDAHRCRPSRCESCGLCIGGMPTQITVAPSLWARCMKAATRAAYMTFHCGDV